MKDIFTPIIPEKKYHPSFEAIREDVGNLAARKMLNEIYNSLPAIDRDFIEQFQSTGFDARIWELYLTATFQSLDFTLGRNYARPDFQLLKENNEILVEATTSNPAFNEPIPSKFEVMKLVSDDEEKFKEFIYSLRKQSTIRVAGALFNKLNKFCKSYKQLAWVKNKPFVIAVAPFHHSMAQWLSDSDIVSYLYGFKNSWSYDESQSLNIFTHAVQEHIYGNKKIPSNFFDLPDSEYISAVIYSNSGTISKFSRMGTLKGYGCNNVMVTRFGNAYDPDPNATLPIPFYYTVGVNGPEENWSQGMAMYHNPKAKYPIDRALFPGVLHGYFDKEFYAYVPDFFPVQSETLISVFV